MATRKNAEKAPKFPASLFIAATAPIKAIRDGNFGDFDICDCKETVTAAEKEVKDCFEDDDVVFIYELKVIKAFKKNIKKTTTVSVVDVNKAMQKAVKDYDNDN